MEFSIDRLDPRVRILVVVLFAFSVVFCNDISALLYALLLSILLAFAAHLTPYQIVKKMLVVEVFIIFLLLMLPFTLPGSPLFQIGPWTGSKEGVLKATTIALKSNAILLAVVALVSTLDAITFGHALARLKVPEKLVHLIFFTVRYVDTVQHEFKRMRQSMKARAFRIRSNRHTWKTLGYLVGMLLIKSLERAEDISMAMKCRGFTGKYYILNSMRIQRVDIAFIATTIMAISILLVINRP